MFGLIGELIRGLLPAPKHEEAPDVVEACGRMAIAKLLSLWEEDIHDPRHNDVSLESLRWRDRILDVIHEGGGWRWVKLYVGDGADNNPQWCGFTQGFGWRDWIPEAMRRDFWASCYRLDHWASYRDLVIGENRNKKVYPNPKPASGPLRGYWKLDENSKKLPKGYEFQVGDIAMVGDGKPDYGDHIVGLMGYDPDARMFLTIEGNGAGLRADGSRGQGVVKARRPVGSRHKGDYHVRRILRPSPQDLIR